MKGSRDLGFKESRENNPLILESSNPLSVKISDKPIAFQYKWIQK